MCLGEVGVVSVVTDGAVPGHVLVDLPARGVHGAVTLVGDLSPGDHVLVHAGYVLDKLSAAQAATAAAARISSNP